MGVHATPTIIASGRDGMMKVAVPHRRPLKIGDPKVTTVPLRPQKVMVVCAKPARARAWEA